MENFFQFGALLAATTFAGAGIYIKKINTKNFFSIPFYEGLFSLILMLLIITLFISWDSIIHDNSIYSLRNFVLAATLSSTGTMVYVYSLSKTQIGVVLTMAAALNIVTASIYDYIVNSISFDLYFILGGVLILVSIFMLNFKSFFSKSQINIVGAFGGMLTGILWGSAVFFNDNALMESNIFIASLVRSITGIIVMLSVSYFVGRKIQFSEDLRSYRLFIITVILLFISNIVWFVSLEYTSGSLTTIFGSSAPVFGIILGYIFLKEKITKIELLSIFIALCGVLAIITNQ